MKKYFLILVLLPLALQLKAQSFTYTLDPSSFNIVNENIGDTMLWFTANSHLRTQRNFSLQKNGSEGKIQLRTTIDHPDIKLFDANGAENIRITSEINGSGGAILLSDMVNGDTNSIRLTTNFGGTGDARIVTDELQINGGADLAEMFDITNDEDQIIPGLLVSIDPKNAGKLKVTNHAFDQKIAGIIAGANGIKPGILMGQDGTEAFGDQLVTLNGRTYVRANNSGGTIKIGDLLTSSNIQGEAMRVKNRKKAQGAIIGKAMTEIDESGFVLILVNLQ